MSSPAQQSDVRASAPMVSVVIATYHWSSVLALAIASVLDQTFTDFEVIVVGDGCSDDTEDVVANVADPRVQWVNLSRHHGHQWAANNEGIRHARGRFVAYLGHDDLWLPHHLGACVEALEGGADLAHTLCMMVHGDGVQREWAPPEPGFYRPGSGLPPSCVVHRRALIESVGPWRDPKGLELHPDRDLWRRMHAAGARFAMVPRLGVVKFPAVWRRDVYRDRPSHEQAHWLQRSRREPAFEAIELARLLAMGDAPRVLSAQPYAEVRRDFTRETWRRIRARLRSGSLRGLLGRNDMDAVRRFKGL